LRALDRIRPRLHVFGHIHESYGTQQEGETLLVRPDTDVYLLAAMLEEILASGRVDRAAVEAHATRFSGLSEIVKRYPAERVAPVVGLEAAEIRSLAREFADAPSASATGRRK